MDVLKGISLESHCWTGRSIKSFILYRTGIQSTYSLNLALQVIQRRIAYTEFIVDLILAVKWSSISIHLIDMPTSSTSSTTITGVALTRLTVTVNDWMSHESQSHSLTVTDWVVSQTQGRVSVTQCDGESLPHCQWLTDWQCLSRSMTRWVAKSSTSLITEWFGITISIRLRFTSQVLFVFATSHWWLIHNGVTRPLISRLWSSSAHWLTKLVNRSIV